MKRNSLITIVIFAILWAVAPSLAQRRITPVNTPATRTQPKNDTEADSARALERRRARSIHYHDENGNTIMVDTITGTEWVDSTLLPKAPPMKYPLLYTMSAGINLWDPVMRLFGQHYGGADAFVNVNLHNRYIPTFEFGMGAAKNSPADNNYTYRSPLAPYFKIGADYNFLYNSNPAYQFFAGLRYGFSPFRFSVEDVTLSGDYWGEDTRFNIPSVSVTAGWFEVVVGLRVQLWGPISAGWSFKYHQLLHQSHPATGDAWYIPGYGTSGSAISGAFNIVYTIPFKERPKPEAAPLPDDNGL